MTMNATPSGNRTHIGIFGRRNAPAHRVGCGLRTVAAAGNKGECHTKAEQQGQNSFHSVGLLFFNHLTAKREIHGNQR